MTGSLQCLFQGQIVFVLKDVDDNQEVALRVGGCMSGVR